MVDRAAIAWELAPAAARSLHALRASLGEAEYAEEKRALQEFLTGYFNAEVGCRDKQGHSISPLGGTPRGGKLLKVRWALPGGGKSGGLRLVVIAYCDVPRVLVADAFLRASDPTDEEFDRAAADAEA